MQIHRVNLNTQIETPDSLKRKVLREKAQMLINEMIELLGDDPVLFNIFMNVREDEQPQTVQTVQLSQPSTN